MLKSGNFKIPVKIVYLRVAQISVFFLFIFVRKSRPDQIPFKSREGIAKRPRFLLLSRSCLLTFEVCCLFFSKILTVYQNFTNSWHAVYKQQQIESKSLKGWFFFVDLVMYCERGIFQTLKKEACVRFHSLPDNQYPIRMDATLHFLCYPTSKISLMASKILHTGIFLSFLSFIWKMHS